jgi:hypothetical protein
MSAEELELGFKWLVNKLYEPKAFEHRLMRFIDKLEPVPGVDDSVSDLQPRVSHVTMEWLRLYQQIRFMYKHGGIWNPDFAKADLPFQSSTASAA